MVGNDDPQSRIQDPSPVAEPAAETEGKANVAEPEVAPPPGDRSVPASSAAAAAPPPATDPAQAPPAGAAPLASGSEASAPAPAEPPAAEPPPEPDWKEQHDKTRNQLLRVAADFENFKKRTRRDLQDVAARARDEVLQELLPVIDNLERAIDHAAGAQESVDADTLLQGVQMVLRSFQTSMERFGIRGFVSVGELFDPNFHEAISARETGDQAPGTVLEEYRRGYLMGERLVRPAMVVVARAPAENAGDPAGAGDAPAPAPEGGDAAEGGEPETPVEPPATSDPGGESAATSVSAPEERS